MCLPLIFTRDFFARTRSLKKKKSIIVNNNYNYCCCIERKYFKNFYTASYENNENKRCTFGFITLNPNYETEGYFRVIIRWVSILVRRGVITDVTYEIELYC